MRIVFFFNDTAPTEIYTLSLHDALPICLGVASRAHPYDRALGAPSARALSVRTAAVRGGGRPGHERRRSEEHTSELQSQSNLVCRLLLEKKKIQIIR